MRFVCVSGWGRTSILYVGEGVLLLLVGDLMLMRSIMWLNREREGNRLGCHVQGRLSLRTAAHSPFYSPLRCAFALTFLQPATVKSHHHQRATHHPPSTPVWFPLFSLSHSLTSPSFPTDAGRSRAASSRRRGRDFRRKWIVPLPSCKWSQLWVCKFSGSGGWDAARGGGWLREVINSLSGTRIIPVYVLMHYTQRRGDTWR